MGPDVMRSYLGGLPQRSLGNVSACERRSQIGARTQVTKLLEAKVEAEKRFVR